MAFLLRPTSRVERDIKRAARERLDDALSRLDLLDADPGAALVEEQVHEIRKRCKEARGLARLVRPSLGARFDRFNALVGDAAAELSGVRDAHAVLGTLDRLLAASPEGSDPPFASVRAILAEWAVTATEGLQAGDQRIADARRKLTTARRDIRRWDLPGGFDPIATGLGDTYRRGERALERVGRRPTDERVHGWRKAVKQLWYQVRLLEPAAPSVLGASCDALDALSDALGDDHDLAVLAAHLATDEERFGGAAAVADLTRLVRSQQAELRERAVRLGSTIYAEPRRAFVARIAGYWELTLADGPERPTGGIDALLPERRKGTGPSERATGGGIERERKFLVTSPIDVPPGIGIRQGYLAIDDPVSVRIRDAGGRGCTLTLKAGSGATRLEHEWEIDRVRFDELWAHAAGRCVTKTRSRLPIGDHTAEVDVFHDELEGLVVAEVEFDSDASMAAFTPPAWFGPEVTDDLRYTNSALAAHGLDPELLRRRP